MTNAMFTKIVYKLSLLIMFLRITISVDTLLPNQTIGIGQTLVSENQIFELQFFSPGKSSNMFLGIRYKSTPDVVVWVANRNDPITDSQGVVLATSGNGSVVISRDGSVIWSGNPSGVASNPLLQLLDTGNLVVVDETTRGYIWQSFDYPVDTWLPGMKLVADDMDGGGETYLTSWRNSDDPSPGDIVFRIVNQGMPELVAYRGENKVLRSGQWNGIRFSSSPPSGNTVFKAKFELRGDRLISMTWSYESSIVVRSKLDASGELQRLTMNSQGDMWTHVMSFPQDKCGEYGHCGPYAICRIEKVQRCECFPGFKPVSQNDWERQHWYGGCRRVEALNCEGGDDFLKVEGVNYPDMLKFWINTSMSLGECKAQCLKNCSCTAVANPYVTDGGSGCVMWLGDLIDIRHISDADENQNLYFRLPISVLGDTTKSDNNEEKKKRTGRNTKLIVILVTCGVVLAGLIIMGVICWTTRRKRAALKKANSEDLELPLFKFATIMAATQGFSWDNLIGEGGFGPVYKGNLSAGEEIAVKRLSTTSQQGIKEFKNEVILIAKLQHRNLVKLLGCCIEGEERMLIYEYLQNKSLNYFVFDQNGRTVLTWPKRFDIIMGIARGLLYLHQDSRLKIIHRDLKTSNILLDGDLNPKISDFGLARIFGEGQSIATTRRVVGTYGYMAPEYAIDGKYSVKSDMFALGVILLEIVSGKKNRGFDHCDHSHNLLGHAWLLWKENNILELMDECLSDTFIESQVRRCIHMGLLCVQKFAEDRPAISSVVSMLGNDRAIIPEPKEPGFFIERSLSPSCKTSTCQETLTVTELEAR
ncbi:G-type lectin S-receptor-like serine/threonine-protein kinase At4g27290 [Salvia miltiorrhiza]|uniref:G-type lectin S-receptor-like serine/threonine-protein kinase At4g27290 n=1 Tax=Salvia miltiorrhiza TaxID=226208 RepID=UPI0025ABE3F5|nr:G-type lectin S-receptor-like serine/threonine-protein kinase At4g27290 [Salvia miltiorrhiza]